MGVPKKRTSISKKRIRKNIWKQKGYWAALKALSLAESILTEKSKSFCLRPKNSTINAKGFGGRQKNSTKNAKGFGGRQKNSTKNAKGFGGRQRTNFRISFRIENSQFPLPTVLD